MPSTIKAFKCRMCGGHTMIDVTDAQLAAWRGGELIQNAMPNLTADERELLISRTCGACWDDMFGFDEEDEESLERPPCVS